MYPPLEVLSHFIHWNGWFGAFDLEGACFLLDIGFKTRGRVLRHAQGVEKYSDTRRKEWGGAGFRRVLRYGRGGGVTRTRRVGGRA